MYKGKAYNLLQLAHKRHLRPRDSAGGVVAPPAWRRLFEWVRKALRLPLLLGVLPGPS